MSEQKPIKRKRAAKKTAKKEIKETNASLQVINDPLKGVRPKMVVTEDTALKGELQSVLNEIKASYTYSTNQTTSLSNKATWQGNSKMSSDLNNVANGISPWNNAADCVDVQEAISMCQKAYWNVSIFRQTIDVQSEFCNSDLYFEGENKAAVKFFSEWDKKINGWDHRDQFFREFFRSGNIFLYRVDTDLPNVKIRRTPTQRAEENAKIPIRYVLMNPTHVKAGNASNFINTVYYKFLNNFEVERLRLPDAQKTEDEKEIWKALSPEERKTIKESRGHENVKIKLDPDKLHTVFCKKQDYEPLSVPMYFPVLYDINLKLELKKAESIIARTVDYIVLLITVGDKDTGGDTNQELIDQMNLLFQSESVGRVLCADYTTKMDFITPDLNKIMGAAKYETVNQDIANGLMNIFFKEEKFSNSSIKIKVFMERLNEARKAYMENFLKPEMKRIGDQLGFKSIPEPKFKEIDLRDEVELWKLYNRLAELGLITPEELFDAYEGKKLPLAEDSVVSQKEFKKLKEEGLYEPLMGAKGTSGSENGGGREPGVKVKDQKQGPVKNAAAKQEFSLEKLKEVVSKADKVFDSVQESFKKKYNIKRLSKAKKEMAYCIAKNIYASEDIEDWANKVDEYVDNPLIQKDISTEIAEIAETHSLDFVNACFLYYSKKV